MTGLFPQNGSQSATRLFNGFFHMPQELILASGSEIRAKLLTQACIPYRIDPARIDEEAVRAALEAEEAKPRDIADTLAELKARKISDKHPEATVLGCDQVLALGNTVFGKAADREEAFEHLSRLSGQTHMLLSAAVIVEAGQPTWRHVGVVRLTMHSLSRDFIEGYLDRNWPDVQSSVGGYKIEGEGVRLFSRIQGDHFSILGLPLLEFMNHLILKGELAT